MESSYGVKMLNELFHEITNDLTLQDWRKIRTPEYFKADRMPTESQKLKHKIQIITEWKDKNRK